MFSTNQSAITLRNIEVLKSQEVFPDWSIYLIVLNMIGQSKLNDRLHTCHDPKCDVRLLNLWFQLDCHLHSFGFHDDRWQIAEQPQYEIETNYQSCQTIILVAIHGQLVVHVGLGLCCLTPLSIVYTTAVSFMVDETLMFYRVHLAMSDLIFILFLALYYL